MDIICLQQHHMMSKITIAILGFHHIIMWTTGVHTVYILTQTLPEIAPSSFYNGNANVSSRKEAKWEIIGFNKAFYVHDYVKVGHDNMCIPTEAVKHHFLVKEVDTRRYFQISFSVEYGICSSGWTEMSIGCLSIKQVAKIYCSWFLHSKYDGLIKPFTDNVTEITNEYFLFDKYGPGGSYYPEGFYNVKEEKFIPASRAMLLRPVWVCEGDCSQEFVTMIRTVTNMITETELEEICRTKVGFVCMDDREWGRSNMLEGQIKADLIHLSKQFLSLVDFSEWSSQIKLKCVGHPQLIRISCRKISEGARRVWILEGPSALGKSFLTNSLPKYETDISPTLPHQITHNIIVIGNKYYFPFESIRKRCGNNCEVVHVYFEKEFDCRWLKVRSQILMEVKHEVAYRPNNVGFELAQQSFLESCT
jgi:hypothetical protein